MTPNQPKQNLSKWIHRIYTRAGLITRSRVKTLLLLMTASPLILLTQNCGTEIDFQDRHNHNAAPSTEDITSEIVATGLDEPLTANFNSDIDDQDAIDEASSSDSAEQSDEVHTLVRNALSDVTNPSWKPPVWQVNQSRPCSKRYPLVWAHNPAAKDVGSSLSTYVKNWKGIMWSANPNNFKLVSGIGGQGPSIQVTYFGGRSGYDNGVSFLAEVYKDKPRERSCIRYDVYFEPGFDYKMGGKMPGIWGGSNKLVSCVMKNGITDDFHARLMFGKGGIGVGYIYPVNKPTLCGMWLQKNTSASYRSTGDIWFPAGRWITVEEEIILNDPSRANGLARYWINGVLTAEMPGLIWRKVATQKIRGFYFSTFHGGSGPDWAPSKTTRNYYRNFQFYAQ